MDQTTLEVLGRTSNGACIMLAMLVDELDKRGALSKADFAALLDKTATDVDEFSKTQPGLFPRQEPRMMRQVIKYLDVPRGRPWTPVVIEGDKK